jgi:hypothetical protein
MYLNNELTPRPSHLRVCGPAETRSLAVDGTPTVESVADQADRLARHADELAALVEQIAREDSARMAVLSSALGELHAGLDELTSTHNTEGEK